MRAVVGGRTLGALEPVRIDDRGPGFPALFLVGGPIALPPHQVMHEPTRNRVYTVAGVGVAVEPRRGVTVGPDGRGRVACRENRC